LIHETAVRLVKVLL